MEFLAANLARFLSSCSPTHNAGRVLDGQLDITVRAGGSRRAADGDGVAALRGRQPRG